MVVDGLTMNESIRIVLTAIMPYLELRGAIPLALVYGATPTQAFLIGVAGNLIPIIPIMVFLPIVHQWANRCQPAQRFCQWIQQRTDEQQEMVNRYGFFGLTFFVAIPLPMTGVWTGAVVAHLLGIRKRHAFFALMLGTIMAGVIVTLTSTGVASIWW